MTGATGAPAEDPREALRRFTRTSEIVATDVLRSYSTSFGLATGMLGRRHRQHVRNIYAMVRIADEIVDGVAEEAGLDQAARDEALSRYVAETHEAMRTGYSSNIVVHAFARTARDSGIGEDLTQPFFDSMRADVVASPGPTEASLAADAIALTGYDADAHQRYVYGSAEVIGLMCLRVFLRDATVTPADLAKLERGARRLGAAFQNINFLRDLADDTQRLHRGYLGGGERLSNTDRDEWVRLIRAQLGDADEAITLLPRDARAAVRSAQLLFAALTDRVARTPVDTLYRQRVRVPDVVKALLALRALWITGWEARR